MKNKTTLLSLAAMLFTGVLTLSLWSAPAPAIAGSSTLPDRVLGDKNAPVTIIEYASFTCSHCSAANNITMPIIKKKYIDTGKVKLIYRDYPMDGISLKAAVLARCLPEDKYYPFIKIVHKNFKAWLDTPQPVETLTQYAQMSGLSPEKAKACLEDTKLMDALIAVRKEATEKYKVQATPTFILNDDAARIEGNQPTENFIKAIDKLLAKES